MLKRRIKIVLVNITAVSLAFCMPMVVHADYNWYDEPNWVAAGKEFMRTNERALRKPVFVAQDPTDPMSAVAIDTLQRLLAINDEFVEKCTWDEACAYYDLGGGDYALNNFFEYVDYDWKTKDGKLVLDHNARVYPVVKYFDSRLNDGAADYDIKNWVAQFNNQDEIALGWTNFIPESMNGLDVPYAYGIAVYASGLKNAATPVVVEKGHLSNVQFGSYVSYYSVLINFTSYGMSEKQFELFFDQNNRLLNICCKVYRGETSPLPALQKLVYQAEKCNKGQKLYMGL